MENIKSIIENEELRLLNSTSSIDKLNISYNLIIYRNSVGDKNNNYKNIKKLIDYYIELIKESNFGYDSLNYNKLNKVLSYLKYEEQISVLKYSLSALTRELPEHDKEWFLKKLNKVEIDEILCKNIILKYPKAFFLFAGMDLKGLLIVLFIFIGLVYIVLLPAPFECLSIFNITYEKYSTCFYFNHLLNIFSLFSDLDNNFKITPRNGFGLIMMILSKIIFFLLIVNFIYKKVSDKISIK